MGTLYMRDTTLSQEIIDRRRSYLEKSKKLNEVAKDYFKGLGFKVIKHKFGYKACKNDVDLTFFFGATVVDFCWSYAEKHGEYCVYAKIPYTNIEVADFYIKLNTVETDAEEETKMRKLFADKDFAKLVKWRLPYTNKKFI